MAASPVLALDTETGGLDPFTHQLILICLSDGASTLLCDVRGHPRAALQEALGPVLMGGPLKVLHHARFDLRMLYACGLDAFPVADTMLNELLLENGRSEDGFSLQSLARRYLSIHLSKEERSAFVHVGHGALPPSLLAYARKDVLCTWQVFLQQVARLPREGAQKVARLEALAVRAVAAMEHEGIAVDQDAWRKVLRGAASERDAARAELDGCLRSVANVDLLGHVDLNYESDQDVRAVLQRLGVKLVALNNQALKELNHPATAALVRYREAQKLVSTYGEGFLQYVHPSTGRLHASFRQLGASTGRMACERPNLQNVPKGSALRSCFRAPTGRLLITADYAACELRILAHLSQDPVFLRAFEEDDDVHARVASQVFGVQVTKAAHAHLRERAKAISFGLIYGMGAAGLAAQTGQSLEDAEILLRQYFQQFPAIDATLKGLEDQARTQGYAKTVLGRRMYLAPDVWERNPAGAARLARNMPIQGASADITKLAMAFIHQRLQGTGAFLVNSVHDELLVECRLDQAETTAAVVKEEMERAMRTVVPNVPPKAEVRVASSWSKG
jgi:DNA polymerase-1